MQLGFFTAGHTAFTAMTVAGSGRPVVQTDFVVEGKAGGNSLQVIVFLLLNSQ